MIGSDTISAFFNKGKDKSIQNEQKRDERFKHFYAERYYS